MLSARSTLKYQQKKHAYSDVEQSGKWQFTLLSNFFSLQIRYKDATIITIPWAQSPNITANRKGKVTIVKHPGLTSWYRATLHN
jgi:hypothetical protein